MNLFNLFIEEEFNNRYIMQTVIGCFISVEVDGLE